MKQKELTWRDIRTIFNLYKNVSEYMSDAPEKELYTEVLLKFNNL